MIRVRRPITFLQIKLSTSSKSRDSVEGFRESLFPRNGALLLEFDSNAFSVVDLPLLWRSALYSARSDFSSSPELEFGVLIVID
jgi:hypothetical protein